MKPSCDPKLCQKMSGSDLSFSRKAASSASVHTIPLRISGSAGEKNTL